MKKQALPPTYLLVSLLLMLAFHYLFPIFRLVPGLWVLSGILPMVLGIGVNIVADRLFTQARTTVNSFGEPTILVTEGVFKITRNPMYLGMVLVLLGVAIMLGSLSTFLVIPIFVWLITVRFIKFEERMLADKFGSKWLDYATRVRRWI